MMTPRNFREAYVVRIVVSAATVGALLWLATANLGRFNAPESHSIQAQTAPAATSMPAAQPSTMEIVPSPVIDPSSAHFTGTGDGSNGGWELEHTPTGRQSEADWHWLVGP